MSLSIGDLRGRARIQPARNALFTNTDLDRLLGAAGIPRGRLTEIFGASSSGKTGAAFAALAACTAAGLLGAYVDPAGTFYAPAAAGAGIRLDRVIVVRPRTADLARRAVDSLVRGGACALVVFDCEGLGEALHTHQCARLAAQAEKTDTALLALSGGGIPALAYFASLRLHASGLRPVWQPGVCGGPRLAGYVASFEVAKSRMSVPGRSAVIEAALPDVAGTWPASDVRCSMPSEARREPFPPMELAAHA